MAYILRPSFREKYSSVSAAAFTVNLPSGEYAAGDLLIAHVENQGGATTITITGAPGNGWNIEAGQALQSNTRSVVAWKVAASASETDPEFNGANNAWRTICFAVRDADQASPITGTSALTGGTGVLTLDSGSHTAAHDNALLLYFASSPGTGNFRMPSDVVTVLNADLNANHQGYNQVGYRQAGTAAASPTVTAKISASANAQMWVVGIKNAASGVLQDWARSGVTELMFNALTGTSAHPVGTVTFSAASGFAGGATINGIATSATATISAAFGDGGRWWSRSNVATSTVYGTAAWMGAYADLSAATVPDLTGAIVGIEWSVDNAATSAQWGAEGIIMAFHDSSNNWVAYRLMTPSWSTTPTYRTMVKIGTTTPYAASAGAFDPTDCTGFLIAGHRSTSAGQTSINFKNLVAILAGDTAEVVGGGAAVPASWVSAQRALSSCGLYKLGELQGSAQVLSTVSVQIGDGVTPTYFDSSAQALEFPLPFDATGLNGQREWQGGAGSLVLGVLASASDVINVKAGSAVTTQEQDMTIASGSSTSATYSTAGSTFVGFAPTWKTGVACNDATFNSCGPIAFKGASPSGITVAGTTAGASEAACIWDTSGATLTDSEIDVTGTSAGYHIELGTAVTSITLADVTFTGTPGTDKVHVLATTGTVTINISGTTTLVAGDVTSAGATVNIVSTPLYQTVTVSGATAGSRIQIYDTTNAVELYNGTPTFPHTWTDSAVAAGNRDIRLRCAYVNGASAKQFIEANIGTCGTTSASAAVSYLVNQENDTTYNNNAVDGSAVTGITFTDAATDLVNIDLSGGSSVWPNIYAAFAYWMFTAAGIADDIAYISAPDTANYLLTSMKLKNTTSPSVPLVVSSGYGRDATSGLSADIIDTTGGMIFLAPDHVVPFATGSGVTAQDKVDIAAEVMTAATTTPIHSDVRKVVGTTIDGAGTEANPWGPA